MKSILTFFSLLALVAVSAPVVSADTSPDRSRTVITRTTDVVDRVDRDRTSNEETEGTTEEDNTNGFDLEAEDNDVDLSGIVLDVSYDSDGNLQVNFNNGSNSGNANISITINGETMSHSGNQTDDQGNESTDGADGNDGRDGSVDEEDDEEEPEESAPEADEPNDRYDSRDARETSDRNPRR
ncbi:hypothetical protein H6778_00350 [Candidatus Nomurabacteria bacterium]|nr:hypothetical protein [Candidatus Nomurabacteria bacterium]